MTQIPGLSGLNSLTTASAIDQTGHTFDSRRSASGFPDLSSSASASSSRTQERDRKLEQTFLDEREPAAQHSWQPIDLVALELQPPSPPSTIGLLYPARRYIFSGEPETLKTA
jgi:hypothetical protein